MGLVKKKNIFFSLFFYQMGIFAGHEYKFYSKIQAIINMVHRVLVKTNHSFHLYASLLVSVSLSLCTVSMRVCVSVVYTYYILINPIGRSILNIWIHLCVLCMCVHLRIFFMFVLVYEQEHECVCVCICVHM